MDVLIKKELKVIWEGLVKDTSGLKELRAKCILDDQLRLAKHLLDRASPPQQVEIAAKDVYDRLMLIKELINNGGELPQLDQEEK